MAKVELRNNESLEILEGFMGATEAVNYVLNPKGQPCTRQYLYHLIKEGKIKKARQVKGGPIVFDEQEMKDYMKNSKKGKQNEVGGVSLTDFI